MSAVIKLSAPESRAFWEIPVLFEDDHLLALNKPAGMPVSPSPESPDQPDLISMLHGGIEVGKPWAVQRGLTYLMVSHRLDTEISGVLLFAKSKTTLMALSDLFGTEAPVQTYLALARGEPSTEQFTVDAKLASHPVNPELVRVDFEGGKKSKTDFSVLEKFPRGGCVSLRCRPLTQRRHQIRVHLRHAGFPLVGDALYGGKPLWLSRLKSDYRLKEGREERPLLARVALHLESLEMSHPVTSAPLAVSAPWPKDLQVAVKYLRQFGV